MTAPYPTIAKSNYPTDPVVRPAQPRTTAQVKFADGRSYEAPVWIELEQYIRAAEIDQPWASPIVAAMIDEELRELTYHIERDVEVTPLGMDDRDGSRVYRRSLTFLLVVAIQELFPAARLRVDHSVTFGGYYCEAEGRPPFTGEELAQIEARMREIVAADAPIGKQRVPLAEAIKVFRSRGDDDMARLMRHRRKDFLVLYTLRGISSYFHGYMVPSTGYLRHFALAPFAASSGFVLRFPHRSGLELEPAVDYPKLIQVFREYGHTLRLLGVEDVGALDDAIQAGRTGEIILVAEALHEQRIARIATQIAERKDQLRMVLIAGPSSSGKTTFSKRLAVQLLANGIRPIAIELDSYFVDRALTPRDAQGNYNFEVLEALDLQLFNHHLLQLMAGEEVTLPKFNFVTGKREAGATIQLGPDQILIVEGIHGLESTPGPGHPGRTHLPHLCLRADAAQHRPLRPRAHHRHAADPPHRAGCAHARLFGRGHHRPLGERDRRGARAHLPLPGKRRRDVQLGAGLRAVGAQAVRRAAPAPD